MPRHRAALERLDDGIRSARSSETRAKRLDTLAKFHDYNLNDTMLMPCGCRLA